MIFRIFANLYFRDVAKKIQGTRKIRGLQYFAEKNINLVYAYTNPIVFVCCYSMMNVGVQCCKRSGVPIAIRAREKIRVDPFGSKITFLIIFSFPLCNY